LYNNNNNQALSHELSPSRSIMQSENEIDE